MIEGLGSAVVVFNAQRHSLGDESGIGMTGFLRRCPLRCLRPHKRGFEGRDGRCDLVVGNGRRADHVFRVVHNEPSECTRKHRALAETRATMLGTVSMRPRVVMV